MVPVWVFTRSQSVFPNQLTAKLWHMPKERMQFGKAIIKFPAVYEIITNMKAKLDASRTLLYETARFVDMYKTYAHISEERALDKTKRLK